jgi:hypothetical protein
MAFNRVKVRIEFSEKNSFNIILKMFRNSNSTEEKTRNILYYSMKSFLLDAKLNPKLSS